MTISSTNRKAGPYAGNGSSTVFPFSFKIFSASDLYVTRTSSEGAVVVLDLGTDFTVSLNANQDDNPGGTVTLSAALESGYSLTVTSYIQPLQPVELTNLGGFYPKIINDALDRLTILIQQLITNGITSGSIGGVITGARNLGTSLGFFKAKVGEELHFRGVEAGVGISLLDTGNTIRISAEGGGTGSGEANTTSNLGAGYGIAAPKAGVDLPLKSLKAGSGVSMSATADEITINATGGGGGSWDGFADISTFGAIGDFVPAAGSTGTGTINDGPVNSAISSGKPLWIPAGNFLVSSAVQTALNNVTTTGPGTLWISTNVGITKMGKMLVIGTNRSHEMQSVGGIKLGGESGDGFRWYMGHHNWSQIQPTKYGAPTQFQLYPSIVCGLATTQATDIINAVHGTFDSTRMTVGDHIGFSNKVYKIAQIISPTQLRLVTFTGGNPGFTTNSTHRTFYHSYETATGTCNTSGTAVTYVSGDQYPYGLSFDHMYAIINGVKYGVTLGPEGLSANQLQLSVSAGTQTNVPIEFRRCWGPYAYVTLFRLQGLGGGIETNAGLYLNIRNEAVLYNSGFGSTYYGDMRINANTTYVGHGDGTGGTEIAEFGLNHVSLGGLFGAEALRAVRVNNAVNWIEVKGADTGFAANIASRGTDPNPDMGFDLQGNGTFRFTAGTFGRTVLEVSAPAGSVAWPTVAADTTTPIFGASGAAASIDVKIQPKGSGKTIVGSQLVADSGGWGTMSYNLLNGWTDATWGISAKYRLDVGSRVVRLSGQISGGENGSKIYVLPAGYRPLRTVVLSTVGSGVTAAAVQILTDGSVHGFGVGSPVTQVVLDGLTFPLD